MSLDEDQVQKYVIYAAKVKKNIVMKELKGKLVYIKFNAATRIRINYL